MRRNRHHRWGVVSAFSCGRLCASGWIRLSPFCRKSVRRRWRVSTFDHGSVLRLVLEAD